MDLFRNCGNELYAHKVQVMIMSDGVSFHFQTRLLQMPMLLMSKLYFALNLIQNRSGLLFALSVITNENINMGKLHRRTQSRVF